MDMLASERDIEEAIATALDGLETMYVGQVVMFDLINNTCDVQPVLTHHVSELIQIPEGVLFSCPVATIKTQNFYIRSPYAVGDLVYVGCAKKSIDQAISLPGIKPNKLHGVDEFRKIDGVILGGIMGKTEPRMDPTFPEDLVIKNRLNTDVVVMKKTGGILINTANDITMVGANLNLTGNVTVNGKITATGDVATTGKIQALDATFGTSTYSTHTHTNNAPAPGPTSPPVIV